MTLLPLMHLPLQLLHLPTLLSSSKCTGYFSWLRLHLQASNSWCLPFPAPPFSQFDSTQRTLCCDTRMRILYHPNFYSASHTSPSCIVGTCNNIPPPTLHIYLDCLSCRYFENEVEPPISDQKLTHHLSKSQVINVNTCVPKLLLWTHWHNQLLLVA